MHPRQHTTLSWQQAQFYLDMAGVMFVVLDRDGCVSLINRKGCEILEYEEADIVGRDWFAHFLPEDIRASVRAVFDQLMQGEVEPFEYHENPVLTRSGRECIIAWHNTVLRDDEGQILGTLSAGEDVTRQRQAEQALRESEARGRAILETTVDAVVTIDEQGIIKSFNRAAERMFGYRADEVIGQNVSILMPSPYREEHDGYLRSYLETGHAKIIGIGREERGQRKDGSTFPIDLAVSEVPVAGKRLFTGIIRDISERRDLEREILRISDQERRRIGQDLHDGLGQMLTGIGMICQNLARTLRAQDAPWADEVSEIAELVKEADKYARDLARGLVPVVLDTQGLAEALRRMADKVEQLMRVRCTFETVGDVSVYDEEVATHLYRIAQEAVSNAVRHGKARHIKISLAASLERLRLRVQDDGTGFPDKKPEGPGMGVRIMHHRAHILGAKLEIANGIDGGAVVTCTVGRSGRIPADVLERARRSSQ